jgi:hypothetical protein
MDYDHGIMLLCLKAERAREERVGVDDAEADPAPPDVSAETFDLGRLGAARTGRATGDFPFSSRGA